MSFPRRVRLRQDADGRWTCAAPPPAESPWRWWHRFVHVYSAMEPLRGVINIHAARPQTLRLWGYARVIIVVPGRGRVTGNWRRDDRWPTWDWDALGTEEHHS